MERKALKQFLIRIIPIFVVSMLLWQQFGLSNYYHECVAFFLNIFYAMFHPTGVAIEVVSESEMLIVTFFYDQTTKNGQANLLQITANLPLLVALYLSSPIRFLGRGYFAWLFAALAGLLATHLVTIALHTHVGIMTDPEWTDVARYYVDGEGYVTFIEYYEAFYMVFGMYLFALVLWFPYLGYYIVWNKRVLTLKLASRERQADR